MKNNSGAIILTQLAQVTAERAERAADSGLAQRVLAIKRYQQRRFEVMYADMLKHPRYAGAARYFLDDLYGSTDFTLRDAQFARTVPGLVRLFPAEVVATVEALTALHALSERFDTAMARQIDTEAVDACTYVQAWQRCDHAEDRERQIVLMLRVGDALDAFTRSPLSRHSLRMMRMPARAAGMAALQSFLETGFETFRAMGGAAEFLALIGKRERQLARDLFSIDPAQAARLGQLP